MSIRFNWNNFSQEFVDAVMIKLEEILQQGPPNPSLVGVFKVNQLYLGTIPPKVSLLSLDILQMNHISLLIQFEYAGDGYIEILNDAQINKFFQEHQDYLQTSILSMGSGLSSRASIVPLNLKISGLKLEGKLRVEIQDMKILSIQLMENPIKELKVNSNFDEHLAMVTDIIKSQLMDVVNHELKVNLIKNPVKIPLQ